MTWLKPRRWWLAALLGVLMVDSRTTSGQQKTVTYVPPLSIDDPRIEVIKRSAKIWEARSGPRREVVDQVCLVPDLPTFFQAIATWDEGHFFPILFDDVESSFRFIRAFKPARIVRMPKSTTPAAAGKSWEKAIEAVSASWTDESDPNGYKPRADVVPKGFGPTQPGFVFSSADAPMLAGAVALAAGRFQPLIQIEYFRKFAEVLTPAEADEFGTLLTAKIKERTSIYDRMGDECDFITIAGDWPYAWRDSISQTRAVDDRIARRADPPHRWAYTGRILGDSIASNYKAMCSLFLQPESALTYNGYIENAAPQSDYAMRGAAARLNSFVRTVHISGPKNANIDGWHETFDPFNRFNLILINSSGSPNEFHVQATNGATSDVPFSVPTAVLMIHSYSAENPTDPETIAGRWLANGAFVYFGSMNEPFLQSFRTPSLVSDLIAENLPLSVAPRATLTEPYGTPWRLVYLGDPLYRIKPPSEAKAPRIAEWAGMDAWPTYAESARNSTGSDTERFLWTFKAALSRLQGKTPKGTSGDDLIETLLSINRAKLPADLRPVYDALLIDILVQAKKRSVLKTKLLAIPEAERSPNVKRAYGTILASDLSLAIFRDDFQGARNIWRELMMSSVALDLKLQVSRRVGLMANTPLRRGDWMNLLRPILKARAKSPEAESIASELKRVEAEAKANP